MSDNIKLTYYDETDTLVVKDNGTTKVYKLSNYRNSKLFKYILMAIDAFDGDQRPKEPLTVQMIASYGRFVINSGSYVTMNEGDLFNVTYDGVTYENVEVKKVTLHLIADDEDVDILYLGNLAYYNLEGGFSYTPESRDQLIGNDYPFYLTQIYGEEHVSLVRGVYKSKEEVEISVSLASDSSQSYAGILRNPGYFYTFKGSAQDCIDKFGIEVGKSIKVTINGVEKVLQWQKIDAWDILCAEDHEFVFYIEVAKNNQGDGAGIGIEPPFEVTEVPVTIVIDPNVE